MKLVSQPVNLIILFLFLVSMKAFAIEERFQDTNEGVIHDTETGLMWTKNALLA